MTPPLNDAIITALAQLVDDAQTERREPSHSDLGFQIERAGLAECDPKGKGQTLGKAKRIRLVLSSALEHDPQRGRSLGRTSSCTGARARRLSTWQLELCDGGGH